MSCNTSTVSKKYAGLACSRLPFSTSTHNYFGTGHCANSIYTTASRAGHKDLTSVAQRDVRYRVRWSFGARGRAGRARLLRA
ncbi:hypothetical protein N7537_006606 [Penicillium hordei]|uniref:Uncharacterized protein n=1 Tax=Penicillium hordei TaxID=40994 RepID=A0AAD6E8I4_9EURO|nr:uncharacterized protein N7537_006606 [Penicillium hordei]KAJ5603650.1 hypothetical protein N7537_006606 [Penicillium hordei]